MTYREALNYGENILSEAGIADAATDSRILLFEALGITREEYYQDPWEEISDEKEESFRILIGKRAQRSATPAATRSLLSRARGNPGQAQTHNTPSLPLGGAAPPPAPRRRFWFWRRKSAFSQGTGFWTCVRVRGVF